MARITLDALKIAHAGTPTARPSASLLPCVTTAVTVRPDGSAPGKDEREALAEIADPIARAVRIVALREAKQHRLDSDMAELRAALQRLSWPEAPAHPSGVRGGET